jgi:hypothetical protein
MSGIRVDQNILNQKGTPAFNASAYIDRPTAGFVGRIFISTDTKQLFRDTGTAWDLIADTGSGSSNLEQVTLNGNNTPYGINITNGGLFLLGSANGSIFFAGGGSGQFTTDNANFFWDDTNNRLGLGTATPGVRLDVHSSSGTNATFNGTGVTNALLTFQSAGTSKWSVGNFVSSTVANDFNIYDNVNTVSRLQVHNTGVINIPTSLIIGSTTPTTSYALDVTGTSRFTAAITGLSASFSSTLNAGTTTINGNGTVGSLIIKALAANEDISMEYKTSANVRRAYIGFGGVSSSLFEISNSENGAIDFRTNAAFAARITKEGYFLLNTTSSFYGQAGRGNFEMNGSTDNMFVQKVGDVLQNYIYSNSAQTEIYSLSKLRLSGGNVLINTTTDSGYRLHCNGQPGANGYTLWTNYSDLRLKENITNLDANNILDKICKIRPVTYNYNELSGYDKETRNRRISGFIAQELIEVFPDMVGTIQKENVEYYDTNLSNLNLYLVKAIQELNEKLVRNNIN